MPNCGSTEGPHIKNPSLSLASNGTYSFRYTITGMAPGNYEVFGQFWSDTMGGMVNTDCWVAVGADGTGEGGIDNIPTDVALDTSTLAGGGVMAYFPHSNDTPLRACDPDTGNDDYTDEDDFSDDSSNYTDDYSDDSSDNYTDDYSDDYSDNYSDDSSDFGEEIYYD